MMPSIMTILHKAYTEMLTDPLFSRVRFMFTGFILLFLFFLTLSIVESSFFSGTQIKILSPYSPSNDAGSQTIAFNDVDQGEDDFFAISPSVDLLQKHFTNTSPILTTKPVFSCPDICWQPPEYL
jgi:hypothetical protein